MIMGLYYNKISSYRQAEKEFNDGLQLLKEFPDSALIARTFLGLGNASKNLGEYPEALTSFTKALDYYEHTGDSIALGGVHADLGQVFQLQNDLPQATSHLNTAVHLLGNHNQSVPFLVTLHTLANVYGMRNQLDSALLLDEIGLAVSRKLNLPEQATPFLDNKATCYTLRSQFDSARSLYYQCMKIDRATGNKKQVGDTWLNLGLMEQMLHRDQQAINCIDTSLKLFNESGYRLGSMLCWEALAKLYKDNKQFDKALDAQSNYFAIKDSLLNEKKENAVAEWKAIYETEKKDKEIRLQSALIQKKNLLISFLFITLPLGGLSVYFANRRNKIRKEKAYREAQFIREQQVARDILTAGEKERQRIAAELHDGVAQILSAAWMNLQALGPAVSTLEEEDAQLVRTAAQLVNEGCTEIRQISRNMMPVVLLKHGLIYALHEFVRTIHEKTISASLSVELPSAVLSKATELMLYRVIQECVNNVLKHARATRLDITITEEAQHISVMVEDNGIGMAATGNTASEGMGIQNIRSRINYLHGTVEWSSAGTNGTLVAIYIPL